LIGRLREKEPKEKFGRERKNCLTAVNGKGLRTGNLVTEHDRRGKVRRRLVEKTRESKKEKRGSAGRSLRKGGRKRESRSSQKKGDGLECGKREKGNLKAEKKKKCQTHLTTWRGKREINGWVSTFNIKKYKVGGISLKREKGSFLRGEVKRGRRCAT